MADEMMSERPPGMVGRVEIEPFEGTIPAYFHTLPDGRPVFGFVPRVDPLSTVEPASLDGWEDIGYITDDGPPGPDPLQYAARDAVRRWNEERHD